MRLIARLLLAVVLANPVSRACGQGILPSPPSDGTPGGQNDPGSDGGIGVGTTPAPADAPEPTSLTLGGMAALGIIAYRWKRRSRVQPRSALIDCLCEAREAAP